MEQPDGNQLESEFYFPNPDLVAEANIKEYEFSLSQITPGPAVILG